MLEEIKGMNKDWHLSQGKEGKADALRKALKLTIESGKNTAMRRNQIKKRKIKPKSGIKWANVIEEKRAKEPGVPSFVPPPEPPIGTTTNIDDDEKQREGLRRTVG